MSGTMAPDFPCGGGPTYKTGKVFSTSVHDDLVFIVHDGLALPDLSEQTAVGGVIGLEVIDGGVTSLFRVIEAGMFRKSTSVRFIIFNGWLVTMSSPVIGRP